MGSNDIPPSHVPTFYLPVYNILLQAGGSLWTICYILLTLQSFKDRSYGMPLFALAFNFAWELIFALYVAESPLEQTVFGVWLLIDLFMVYGLVNYGKEEWNGSPLVKKYLGWIFGTMVVWCSLGHWAFAKWWIDNEIGKKEGKIYRGVVAGDTTELGYWTAVVCQVYLSVASLAQLGIRRHTGGVSWGIWATRALGSLVGLHANYGWMWYYWREGHEYFMSPFSIFLWVTALVTDFVYPFAFAYIRKTEKVGPDGRKVAGDMVSVKINKA
ncbi:hypothetical protein DL95DRAFT_523429 [Leptodontidium sp. 2 PMI_412]|nr:hypothetical protein DL95DRAFT_523429 [Leptodontidium sp. 2 PMI_412]